MERAKRLAWHQGGEAMGWRKRQSEEGGLHASHLPQAWGGASAVFGETGRERDRMGPLRREGSERR